MCAEALHTEQLSRQRTNCVRLIRLLLSELKELKPLKKEVSLFKKIKENPIFEYWWNNGKPYLVALYKYFDAINFECFNRKLRLVKAGFYLKVIQTIGPKIHHGRPPTPTRITTGYRVILLSINERYYRRRFVGTLVRYKDQIEALRKSKKRFKYASLLGIA